MASDFPRAIGNPARSALEHAGYTRLEQLANVPERELAELHGMGPRALGVLRETLGERGLSFTFPRAVHTAAVRVLSGAGYTRLEQLAGVSERKLAALNGLGPKVLGVLKDALAARGLSLGSGSLEDGALERGSRGGGREAD